MVNIKKIKANLYKKVSSIIMGERNKHLYQFVIANTIFSLTAVFFAFFNFFAEDTNDVSVCVSFLFSIGCIVNLFLLSFKKDCLSVVAKILFVIEIFAMLNYLIVTGNSDSVGLMLILIIPAFSVVVYHINQGVLISLVGFLMLVFYFFVPMGKALLSDETNDYRCAPRHELLILYVTIFLLALSFETVHRIIRKSLFDLQERYKELYRKDALTGVWNRYGFDAEVKRIVSKKDYRIKQFVFVIFDLDYFKSVNDTYGHDVGDFVLQESASRIANITGGNLCRWGGEEFALLMINNNLNADVVANYCKEFSKEPFVVNDELSLNITVSVGAVILDGNTIPSIDKLYKEADECLYLAKNTGKNRAIIKAYEE